jgi:hypothetical protein
MQLHRNAKLGLRGRRELVLAIESGMSRRRPRPPQRLAGDGAPLVAPLARGRRGGARLAPASAGRAGTDLHRPRRRTSWG